MHEGEGGADHLRQASGLPLTAVRGVAGAPGSSRLLPIPPSPPQVTDFQRNIPAQQQPHGGDGGIGTRSGLDAGGATPHNPCLPFPDATTTTSTLGPPCRARAARRARGAGRERALAGGSGGASGPCRPGLKSHRKLSPPEIGNLPEFSHNVGRWTDSIFHVQGPHRR